MNILCGHFVTQKHLFLLYLSNQNSFASLQETYSKVVRYSWQAAEMSEATWITREKGASLLASKHLNSKIILKK